MSADFFWQEFISFAFVSEIWWICEILNLGQKKNSEENLCYAITEWIDINFTKNLV